MATAGQAIDAALTEILVKGANIEAKPEDYLGAIFALNNLMFDLDAQGIALGYTEVKSKTDELTVPSGAVRGVVMNLAIELAPRYNAPVDARLIDAARVGMDTMRLIAIKLPASNFPSTLPVGSGNYCGSGYDRTFFPGTTDDDILRETTGTIGLEPNTEDAAT